MPRYETLAHHVGRAVTWTTISADTRIEGNATKRTAYASACVGDVVKTGEPLLTKDYFEDPTIGDIEALAPLFHIKSHMASKGGIRGLYYMKKVESPQWYKLAKRWEIYQNHLLTGRIATSATNGNNFYSAILITKTRKHTVLGCKMKLFFTSVATFSSGYGTFTQISQYQ